MCCKEDASVSHLVLEGKSDCSIWRHVRGLVVDDGIRMDGMIQPRELPWSDEQGRWLKNGVDC